MKEFFKKNKYANTILLVGIAFILITIVYGIEEFVAHMEPEKNKSRGDQQEELNKKSLDYVLGGVPTVR